MPGEFDPVSPWPLPKIEDCDFYHCLDLGHGESVTGHWDIRGRFEQYIGHYPLDGKTVLDVGTATGFLAFSAEAAGATVTALDVLPSYELRRVPFLSSTAGGDGPAPASTDNTPMLNSFWYAWHKLNSKIPVIYAPLESFDTWPRRFDVVIGGALLEHQSDPVSAIGQIARLAEEAVIIAFTEVDDRAEPLMCPHNDWTDPTFDYVWWKLSRGLYERVFTNLGFTVEFTDSTAIYNPNRYNVLTAPEEWGRKTIVARRIAS